MATRRSPKLDRLDPAFAGGVFERMLPDAERRREYLELLGDLVARAHENGERCWSVTLQRRGFRLNVGRVMVADTVGEQVWLMLDAQKVPDRALGRLQDEAQESEPFRLLPEHPCYLLDVDTFFDVLPLVRDAYLAFVDLAAGTARSSPYAASHSPGVIDFLESELGRSLPRPAHGEVAALGGDSVADELEELVEQFLESYGSSDRGREHARRYASDRERAAANWEAVQRDHAAGRDVTEAVFDGLLPHRDTRANREEGKWIHNAPAITRDLREWFEGAGWTEPEDWPRVAEAIRAFVARCCADPEDLDEACEEFARDPLSKGFQSGMLTPILNALRPEDFALINSKSIRVLAHYTRTRLSSRIEDYPALNRLAFEFVEDHGRALERDETKGLRPGDVFDQLCHWLVSLNADWPPETAEEDAQYWKIAPGENARLWDRWVRGGHASIGWDELGDLDGVTRVEFDERSESCLERFPNWGRGGPAQVWRFRDIPTGSYVVANDGTTKIVGVGRVTGPYEFVEGEEHAHRLPVDWYDVEPKSVAENGWRRTLVRLGPKKFADLGCVTAPADTGAPLFGAESFALLARLAESPTKEFVDDNAEELGALVEQPLRRLLTEVAARLPEPMRAALEVERDLVSRLRKNDYGRGGAWPYQWGALYPQGGKRTAGPQLFVYIDHSRLEIGFNFGKLAAEEARAWAARISESAGTLERTLAPVAVELNLVFGPRTDDSESEQRWRRPDAPLTLAEWLAAPASKEAGCSAVTQIPSAEASILPEERLIERCRSVFEGLWPLVDPDSATSTGRRRTYSLADCAAETHLPQAELEQWVRAIERKGQAVFYGPPGTGKTFLAEKIAKHLVGGGDGELELVQFHPAYAYEDFLQGIRPAATKDGSVSFELVPGRFLEFCRRAEGRSGRSVLIIDEINRANLAQVFGELMYLLEYRDREIPLAGGRTLRIPSSVRILGTMNTADRSIALVDHALRRRFAFVPLRPRPEVLERFHERTGFPVVGLIATLRRVNERIGDPNFAIGISFFLRDDLEQTVEDVWRMEIVPYLEEYFFDREEVALELGWTNVAEAILPDR